MTIKRIMALVLTGMLLLGSAAAEGFALPENVRLAEDIALEAIPAPEAMPVYTVTTKDVSAYAADLPEELVASVETYEDTAEDGTVDALRRYTLVNGAMLSANAWEMIWFGNDSEKYSQLFSYAKGYGMPIGAEPLAFMSPEEAVEACSALLEDMGFAHLTRVEVQSLSQERIAAITEDMARAWGDDAKYDRFREVTAHHEVYRVTFQSVLDGYPVLEDAQCEFILREDMVVFAQWTGLIEQIVAAEEQPVAVNLSEALRLLYEERMARQRSEEDTYDITGITLGYAWKERGVYAPCWRVDYTMTVRFNGETTTVPYAVLISALDGTIRGVAP